MKPLITGSIGALLLCGCTPPARMLTSPTTVQTQPPAHALAQPESMEKGTFCTYQGKAYPLGTVIDGRRCDYHGFMVTRYPDQDEATWNDYSKAGGNAGNR